MSLTTGDDTYINAWFPEEQYSQEPDLEVRFGGLVAPLLRFDLTTLPPDSVVRRAGLHFYVLEQSNPNSLTAKAFRVLRHWDVQQATWREAATGQPWDQEGCNGVGADREADPVGEAVLDGIGRWITLDVTEAARHWIEHPNENHGLILRGGEEGASVGYNLASFRHPVASARPRLDITYTTPQGYTLHLHSGLNMVSLPTQPDDLSIETVLADISDKLVGVWAFDAHHPDDPWRVYQPGDPGAGIQELELSSGYWFEMSAGASLDLQGVEPESVTIPLRTGWNLVGYPALTGRDAASVVSDVAHAVELVWHYRAQDASDPWKRYSPSMPPWTNDLDTFSPGEGYWILVAADCELTIP